MPAHTDQHVLCATSAVLRGLHAKLVPSSQRLWEGRAANLYPVKALRNREVGELAHSHRADQWLRSEARHNDSSPEPLTLQHPASVRFPRPLWSGCFHSPCQSPIMNHDTEDPLDNQLVQPSHFTLAETEALGKRND